MFGETTLPPSGRYMSSFSLPTNGTLAHPCLHQYRPNLIWNFANFKSSLNKILDNKAKDQRHGKKASSLYIFFWKGLWFCYQRKIVSHFYCDVILSLRLTTLLGCSNRPSNEQECSSLRAGDDGSRRSKSMGKNSLTSCISHEKTNGWVNCLSDEQVNRIFYTVFLDW